MDYEEYLRPGTIIRGQDIAYLITLQSRFDNNSLGVYLNMTGQTYKTYYMKAEEIHKFYTDFNNLRFVISKKKTRYYLTLLLENRNETFIN